MLELPSPHSPIVTAGVKTPMSQFVVKKDPFSLLPGTSAHRLCKNLGPLRPARLCHIEWSPRAVNLPSAKPMKHGVKTWRAGVYVRGVSHIDPATAGAPARLSVCAYCDPGWSHTGWATLRCPPKPATTPLQTK